MDPCRGPTGSSEKSQMGRRCPRCELLRQAVRWVPSRWSSNPSTKRDACCQAPIGSLGLLQICPPWVMVSPPSQSLGQERERHMLIGQDWSHVLELEAGSISQITREIRRRDSQGPEVKKGWGCKASAKRHQGSGIRLSLHTPGCLSYAVPAQGG